MSRNIPPTVLSALGAQSALELAFNARRRQLGRSCDAALGAGRQLSQPSMAWTGGPREQPRDGRGRFLSRAWLAQAETFTAADAAWFRSPRPQ